MGTLSGVTTPFTQRKLLAVVVGALLLIACAGGTSTKTDSGGDNGLGTPAPYDPPAGNPPPAPPPSPTRDPNTITDGTWAVPGDMAPGQWRTTAPPDGHCYWERLKDADGSFSSIIANENIDGGAPGIVTIKATDKFFKTTGGCVWRKVS